MGRNGEWATGRFGVWAMANDRERLKTGAAELQRELHSRHAEFFVLPILRQRKSQPLLALLITAY